MEFIVYDVQHPHRDPEAFHCEGDPTRDGQLADEVGWRIVVFGPGNPRSWCVISQDIAYKISYWNEYGELSPSLLSGCSRGNFVQLQVLQLMGFDTQRLLDKSEVSTVVIFPARGMTCRGYVGQWALLK